MAGGRQVVAVHGGVEAEHRRAGGMGAALPAMGGALQAGQRVGRRARQRRPNVGDEFRADEGNGRARPALVPAAGSVAPLCARSTLSVGGAAPGAPSAAASTPWRAGALSVATCA